MAENVSVINPILKEKLDSYGYDTNKNLTAEGEIMVTITLNEYRELVQKNATREADINKANSDKYSREAENRQLKEEVDKLKSIIKEMEFAEYERRKASGNCVADVEDK